MLRLWMLLGVVVMFAVGATGATGQTGVGRATFANTHEVAVFCAAAVNATISAPAKGQAPSVASDRSVFVHYWFGRALEAGGRAGIASDETVAALNREVAAIHEAFKRGAAPFYDLAYCDDAGEPTLWESRASVIPGDDAPRPPPNLNRRGDNTLTQLADHEEIRVSQRVTGRFREAFATATAEQAFAGDVAILEANHILAASGADSAQQTRTRLRLAELYRERQIGVAWRNSEAAISALEAAAAASVELNLRTFALAELGFAYYLRVYGDRADNLERGLHALEDATAILTPERDRDRWVKVQSQLAGIYSVRIRGRRAENLEKALAAQLAVVNAVFDATDSGSQAAALINLGVYYLARINGSPDDNAERAIAAFERALTIVTEASAQDAWFALRTNLAAAYAARQTDRALNQDRAIAILKDVIQRSKKPLKVARIGLGDIYAERLNGARNDNLALSAEAYEEALLTHQGERSEINIGRKLGAALVLLKRYQDADAALRIAWRQSERIIGPGLDYAEARDVLNDARGVSALWALTLARSGDAGKALAVLSAGKARLLASTIRTRALALSASEKVELARFRAEIRQSESKLEALARSGAGPREELAVIDVLRSRAYQLMAKGERATLGFPDAPDVAPTAELVHDGALIAPVVTEAGAVLLVATPHGKVVSFELPHVSPAVLKAIAFGEGAGKGWIGALYEGSQRAGLEKIQSELNEALGADIRTALDAAGVPRGAHLVILPDGASALLPLAMAKDPKTGRTLLEDFTLSFAPSLAALAASRARAAKAVRARLAIIQPQLEDNMVLAFASAEASLVQAAFRDHTPIARDDTVATALARLEGRSYWHFVTHGVFNWEDPGRSGLLLVGGNFLTVDDIAEVGPRTGTPRLVVLSACETGFSDVTHNADEFTGLPAAFIEAGAAGVVASLWRVYDISTTLLIGKFYDFHLSTRMAPAEALRAAQIWIKDATRADLIAYVETKRLAHALSSKGAADLAGEINAYNSDRPFSDPIYWGAFAYYGA